MPKRTFTIPSTEPTDDDPPVFEIAYKRKQKNGKWKDEVQEFTCLPQLPAGAMRYLVSESSTVAAQLFIERCLATDDDAIRFMLIINDRGVMLTGEELGDVLEWLTATYAGEDHPTGDSSASDIGPMPTGDTSTES